MKYKRSEYQDTFSNFFTIEYKSRLNRGKIETQSSSYLYIIIENNKVVIS